MYFQVLQSDQLHTWSDEYSKAVRRRIAKTPQHAHAPAAPTPSYPPWFPHRALQTMRQAWMQMCRWPGPWPQVLSLGQLPGFATANGLRAAGALRANGGVPGQLSSSPRDPGGDLRGQPRTAAPPRGALTACHATPSVLRPPHTDRCGIGRRTPRQYARSLARRQSKEFAYWRGE